MKLAAIACSIAVLYGCANTAGTAPTAAVSGFDGARVVDIAPHGAACTSFFCPALGAQWSSKAPDSALLTVAVFNDIRGITGAQLSIDGAVLELRKTTALTNFSRPGDAVKTSFADFAVPLDRLRAAASGQHRVWLRVVTTQGAIDAAVIDGTTDSKAYHALRRFLADIDDKQ